VYWPSCLHRKKDQPSCLRWDEFTTVYQPSCLHWKEAPAELSVLRWVYYSVSAKLFALRWVYYRVPAELFALRQCTSQAVCTERKHQQSCLHWKKGKLLIASSYLTISLLRNSEILYVQYDHTCTMLPVLCITTCITKRHKRVIVWEEGKWLIASSYQNIKLLGKSAI
jgi:hypothetical protein